MNMMLVSTLMFLALGVTMTTAVCPANPDPVTPTLDFPTLPDAYTVQSHLVVRNLTSNVTYSIETDEAYDGANKRESLSVHRNGTVQTFIINNNLMEVIVLETETDTQCTVMNTTDLHDFGDCIDPLSGVGGQFDTRTIYQLLQLIPAEERIYQGYVSDSESGYINTTVWTACVEVNETTVETKFYFYANPEDCAAGGSAAVPAQITIVVEGNIIGTENDTVSMEAHYSSYTPDETCETLYQPEGGVYCKGRIAPVSIANITDDFIVTVEVIDLEEDFVTYHETFFDYDLKLVRYDEIPITSKYGRLIPSDTATPQTVIHDYNLGLTYTVEKSTGVCAVTNISASSADAEVDGSYVIMKHASQLFQLDSYIYQGQVTAHGIDGYRWIVLGNETDFPITESDDAVFQLTFAKNTTRLDGTEVQNNTESLLQAEMQGNYKLNSTTTQSFHLLVNYYNFNTLTDVTETSAVTFDISACYSDDEKMYLHIYFPGNLNDVIGDDRVAFLDTARAAMATAADVSQLRFSDFWLVGTVTKMVDDKEMNVIVVGFTLLGLFDVTGDIKNPPTLRDLNTAYTSLKTAVDSEKLILSWKSDSIVAVADSLTVYTDPYNPEPEPVINKHTGFTSGAMAGLAIAMLIIGALGGLGFGWKCWRPAGGFQYQVQA